MAESPVDAAVNDAREDNPENPSRWVREGPVRLLQAGSWRRKNGPVACDLCRQRRVRCSGFETGAPCDSCVRRRAACTIGTDTYLPDAEQRTPIFVAILPPPPAPSATPRLRSQPDYTLELSLVNFKLSENIPRPAPLVWTHPLDAMKDKAPARQLRARDRKNPEKAAPGLAECGLETDELDSSPQVQESTSKKARLAEAKPQVSQQERRRDRKRAPALPKPTLHRFTPLSSASPAQPPTGLAILAAVGAHMLSLETWKRAPRSVESLQERPIEHSTFSFPTSFARAPREADCAIVDRWHEEVEPNWSGVADRGPQETSLAYKSRRSSANSSSTSGASAPYSVASTSSSLISLDGSASSSCGWAPPRSR